MCGLAAVLFYPNFWWSFKYLFENDELRFRVIRFVESGTPK